APQVSRARTHATRPSVTTGRARTHTVRPGARRRIEPGFPTTDPRMNSMTDATAGTTTEATAGAILVGKAVTTPQGGPVLLQPKFGNRHGLVAGATGTGKTVTLMTLAEGFSRIGVPVFMADVKGDVAGLAVPGASNEKLQARIAEIGIDGYANEAAPVVFWDLYGKLGHPVRTTISEMGPL